MKNIVAFLATFIAISALADRTANQEWVKRNFAPTNIVPRVEALEAGSKTAVTAATVTNIAEYVVDHSTVKTDTNAVKSIVTAMKPVKIGKYLWEAGTEGEDFTKCTNRMAIVYPSYGGNCSGVCAGKYHGRNLDWGYNKEASIVVRSPANEKKLGSIGIVGGISAFTDEFLESEQWSEAFYSMPFTWSDGINDKGVVIQQNVVQTNYVKSAAWRTNSTDKIICFCIIRYALDRCSTAEEAANLICSKVFVPKEFKYDFHYLVSDKTSSFIVEDGVVLAASASRPTDVMTNFRIGGTTAFNADKTVDWETVEPFGIGLERYDYVRTNGIDKTTIDGMIKTMKALWYSNTYNPSTDPYWYTEHCDQEKPSFNVMNAKTNQTVFAEEKAAWEAMYVDEHDKESPNYRSGDTWQTIHTAIYDKENLSLLLFTQEDENSGMVFSLKKYDDGLFGISASDVSDIREMIGEIGNLPIGGGFTTLGGLLAALVAAVVWLKKNKANKSDSISGVKLNGTDLDIDATTRKASGTVLTCNPFPEGTITGIGTASGVTTIDFCKSLCKNTSVVAGMMYLGQVRLAEGVGTGGVLADQSEVTVKCIKAVRNALDPNDPENYDGMVILVLEMTSTNQGCRHWMTVYERWGKKSYDYTTYPNGKLAFGSAAKPWYGMLYSVLDDQAGAQNPLAAAYTAASKADVKIKDFQTSGSGNVVTGVSVSSEGMMTVTLGNVSGPAEATDAEIGTVTAPTVSNKMITPKNAPYAVAQGLIHEAQKTAATHVDFSTEQQRDIQTWLGVNELTFVIDNGDSTTTTRKFKFVCTENETTNG